MRLISLLLALAVAACASNKPAASPSPAPSAAVDAYVNGQTIFMTGRDLAGHKITASPPPMRPACVECHRANGSGGMNFPGGVISADLRHHALVNEQKHPYTVALLMRAISTGTDNEGQKLSPVMPRWKMSQQDLRDVATYVYYKLK